jgi:hypothetical protein
MPITNAYTVNERYNYANDNLPRSSINDPLGNRAPFNLGSLRGRSIRKESCTPSQNKSPGVLARIFKYVIDFFRQILRMKTRDELKLPTDVLDAPENTVEALDLSGHRFLKSKPSHPPSSMLHSLDLQTSRASIPESLSTSFEESINKYIEEVTTSPFILGLENIEKTIKEGLKAINEGFTVAAVPTVVPAETLKIDLGVDSAEPELVHKADGGSFASTSVLRSPISGREPMKDPRLTSLGSEVSLPVDITVTREKSEVSSEGGNKGLDFEFSNWSDAPVPFHSPSSMNSPLDLQIGRESTAVRDGLSHSFEFSNWLHAPNPLDDLLF